MSASFAVGIDLGTTNSVVAYSSLETAEARVSVLPIPQLVAPGQVESLDYLPSFLHVPADQSILESARIFQSGEVDSVIVGTYARRISAEQPERTVAAAKSWLCHPHVDRRSPILPWDAPDEVAKISPVQASAIYLRHLVRTWDQQFPESRISEQRVVLTVPASFDVVARELTREAAIQAGLPEDFVLLEEPQAALYHWILNVGDQWRKYIARGDVILVCDVGGGTTDLTLVVVDEASGELQLQRQSVGNHLLVGGDNMDLALAHFAAGRFAERNIKLNAWQSVSLWHSCRAAKESLLSEQAIDPQTISILGRGSRLIGGTQSIEVSRADATSLLVDGFFPKCDLSDRANRSVQSGFQELGLAFESDSGITRHIASFLSDSLADSSTLGQLKILFNGGVFKSKAFRSRLMETMASWAGGGGSPSVLGGPEDLDRAVASGAAYYAWTKQHGGLRIRGGAARSYYVGIETAGLAVPGMPRPLQALCVVPLGMEEGTEVEVPSKQVGLVVGQPARFRFFSSSVRHGDQAGTMLRFIDEEELQETAALEIALSAEETPDEGFIPVRFHSKITELGVFELWCHSIRDDRKWKLEFDIRETSNAPT
jgi:actin-like ATPase involved in cell morphogenesis